MRSTYILLMLGLPALGIASALYFRSELQNFLREIPRLNSTADVERLKQVVARQMYAALAQIVILGLPMVVFFLGIRAKVLGPTDVIFIIVPSVIVLVVAQASKPVEKSVQGMPANDEQLARERDRIVHTWLKKPLPDW